MLDARMQAAYLSSFQYDDIDNTALPVEVDCTPRVGDKGALFLDYPDGSGGAEELMFRVTALESGLPVIELRASADDDWDDEVEPCFFDEISLRGGMFLILRSRAPAAHSPGYPYGMTEDDPKLFDLDTEDGRHGTRAAQWDTATRRMVMGHIRNELDTQQAMIDGATITHTCPPNEHQLDVNEYGDVDEATIQCAKLLDRHATVSFLSQSVILVISTASRPNAL